MIQQNVFAHENQATPSALSGRGHLRSSEGKSKLLFCILEQPAGHRVNERPVVEGELLDGLVRVNMLATTTGGTF